MTAAAAGGPVPPPRRPGYLAFVAVVLAAAALLSAAPLAALPDQIPRLPAAFWLMALLAVICDARPFTPVGRRGLAVFPSVCFTFAILLDWGFAPAVVVQAAAVAVAGWRMRLPVRRGIFTVAQYACALAAAYGVIRVFPGGGVGPDRQVGWHDVVAVTAAAAAWFAVKFGVFTAAHRLRHGGPWWPAAARRGLLFELLAVGSLLLLGPVVLAAAGAGTAMIPLVLVPLYSVYRMARLATEQERLARLDSLTGLANRKALLTEVGEQVVWHAVPARAANQRLALLLIDLDRFKHVNDALGHEVGDRLLVEVGNRLGSVVRPRDLVARLGGDEFAILAGRLPDVEAARRLARQVVTALAEPVWLDGLPLEVGGSIGIALYPDHGADFATLMRHADVAMYDAKQRGASIAVYAPESDQNSAERLGLLADLRQVLEPDAASFTPSTGAAPVAMPSGGAAALVRLGPDALVGAGVRRGARSVVRVPAGTAAPAATVRDAGEITMYYQPQVAIATGEVVGVEALLRWRHPRRGMVNPEELIRVAEQSAVMRLLTRRVVDDVIEQMAKWSAAGLRLRAAVNVSVRDLHSGEIAEQIAQRLDAHELPPDRLQLEITEGALMADPRRVLTTISRLDRIGVAIALDDFGTGYSSMQHLRRLPLSEVKVDRSFVLNMASDADDAAIVRSVIELAGALGLRVVAEGVEDERTWRMLHAAGCEVAQGWFYARPMPAEELVSWLARYRPVVPAPVASRGRHRRKPAGSGPVPAMSEVSTIVGESAAACPGGPNRLADVQHTGTKGASMAAISREEVAHLARLARLAVTEEELPTFAGQLDVILQAVARVGEVAAADIPPTSHSVPLTNVLRDDVVVPGLTPAEALSGAPDAEENRFRVPRILDEEA